jgi:hypothetical protein
MPIPVSPVAVLRSDAPAPEDTFSDCVHWCKAQGIGLLRPKSFHCKAGNKLSSIELDANCEPGCAQGNKWTCPEDPTIDVCRSMDNLYLGDLKCTDKDGIADSATSRRAVIDMLRVMSSSEDCKGADLVSMYCRSAPVLHCAVCLLTICCLCAPVTTKADSQT